MTVNGKRAHDRDSHQHSPSTVIEGGIMKPIIAVGFVVAGLLSSRPLLAGDVTVEAVPAVVVKTVPESGTTNVDPQTAEIKVTFSKDMQDKSWSWSTLSKESFPKTSGGPKYLPDKRTCV